MWLRSSIGGSTLLVLGEGGRDELIADKTLITPDFLNLMTSLEVNLKGSIRQFSWGGGGENKFSMKVFFNKKQMFCF